MAIYKRGGVYWFSFYWRGQHVQESTKQGNQNVARTMQSARRTALAKGEVGIVDRKPAPSLKDFCKVFLANAAIGRRKAPRQSTVDFYEDCLERVKEYGPLASAKLDQITPELLERYIKVRVQKVSPTRCNHDLRTLRRLLHVALEMGLINRCPKITLLQGEHERDFVLSPAQERVYMAAAPEPLKSVAVLMLSSGLRVSEAAGLEWPDIHLEPVNGAKFGYLHVRDGKSRNAKRNVPLTAELSDMLKARSEKALSPWVFSEATRPGPLSTSTVSHQHTKLRRELGFPEGFVVHSFRHTFGTRLGASGVDAFVIKRVMGHSSVSVSEKYVHPTPESLERAFERLEGYNQRAVKSLPEAPKMLKAATIPATVVNGEIRVIGQAI